MDLLITSRASSGLLSFIKIIPRRSRAFRCSGWVLSISFSCSMASFRLLSLNKFTAFLNATFAVLKSGICLIKLILIGTNPLSV